MLTREVRKSEQNPEKQESTEEAKWKRRANKQPFIELLLFYTHTHAHIQASFQIVRMDCWRKTQEPPKLASGFITRPEEVSARTVRAWVKVKDKGDIGQGLISVDQPVLPNQWVLWWCHLSTVFEEEEDVGQRAGERQCYFMGFTADLNT